MKNKKLWLNKLLLGDFIVFFVVLAVAFGMLIYFLQVGSGAEYGEIWENGNLSYKFKLAEGFEKTLTIKGEQITNVIEIQGKKMRFSDSDCFDKTCVHTGWISRAGQVSVCLPNRVMIKITGEEQKNDVDIIVK